MDFAEWGEVEVTGKILVPRDHLPHFAILEVTYPAVRSYNVWHIIRLWHRIYMFSLDSEAINESVASVARYVEKKHGVGRPLEPRSLVLATRLRAAGVRGDLTDIGLLRYALRLHAGRAEANDECHFSLPIDPCNCEQAKGS